MNAKLAAELERELSRLEALDELQLYEALIAMDNDPAPQWVKDLVYRKVRSILNQRLGIAG